MSPPSQPAELPRRGWSEAPWRGIGELLRGPPGALALDWDETSARGDISYLLLRDLDRREPGIWDLLHARIAGDRLVGYRELAARIQAGRTPSEVTSWTRQVASDALATGDFAWVPEIRDLVAAAHAASWSVWVVSGSPEVVVAALADEYGIPAHRVIGMGAVLRGDGRFADQLVEPVTWREGKPARFAQRAGRAPTLAIGDSEGDVALLEAADHAVWIDHGDPTLRATALARGWWRQEGW